MKIENLAAVFSLFTFHFKSKLVLLLLVGEAAAFDVAYILADSVTNVFAEGAIGAQIAGLELLGYAQHVL